MAADRPSKLVIHIEVSGDWDELEMVKKFIKDKVSVCEKAGFEINAVYSHIPDDEAVDDGED